MITVTAERPFEDLLRGIRETAEIRDTTGKVLGHYTPALSPEEQLRYEKASKLFDLEEAMRIAATESHGISLKEIMQKLEASSPRR